jgi:OmpA-OmpF porin, OOP family
MSGIMDTIAQHITPEMITRVSSQLGIDPGTATKAIQAALPGVFGAMADHAKSDSGAAEIHLAAQPATQTATQPAAPVAAADDTPASAYGLLDKMMGHRTAAVQQNVAQSAGIDTHQAGKLLTYLAPVALAVLAHERSRRPQTVQTPGDLSSILQSVHNATQGGPGTPAGLGGLGGLGGMLGQFLG